MKKSKKSIALFVTILMMISLISACSKEKEVKTNQQATNAPKDQSDNNTEKEDTIIALLPPVSSTYQENFDNWCAKFHEMYPNLTLQIEPSSWEDVTDKLDVQVNAGSPPDIAFIGSGGIGKYIETGLLMNISDIVTDDMIQDFEETPLNYFRTTQGLYGLPAYVSIQSIGGNRTFLESAGIDWKKVQKEGWTYEEFRESIKKGTTADRYGFLFACSGVASADYLNILVNCAGMPDEFDKDLKYTYTSKNFLKLLECIRQLIEDGSMPKELNSIDAGARWNMFLQGKTMITGKGLAPFENSARKNNEKIKAGDGSEVEGSIELDYVVLPVPTFFGEKQQAQGAVDGYVCFRGIEEPSKEHMSNVMKAMYFLASNEVAAATCNDLFLTPVCKSGKEALSKSDQDPNRSVENKEAIEILTSQMIAARPDIPTELSSKATQLMNEVIVPKFQALLGGECTPQEMYDVMKKAAIEKFGEDGIVKD